MNRLKKTVTLLFFILNHYALMLRYFMMPKKNQRYANGQRWFYPVRCNYFLAEPASNIETIENNGNDSNLLIVFYVQIMPDDFVMQLHRF
ncbi:beta-galactosidase [Escherichia coli]|nr:beta-galactosidase [Escherichia coli]